MSLRTLLALLLSAWVLPAAAVDNLHDALPADSIAYLRLAGEGDFVGAAPGTALYDAMTAGEFAERGRQSSLALVSLIAADPDLLEVAPWVSLLARLRGPAEAVALLPAGVPPQAATLLVRAGTEAESIEDLNAQIDAWAQQDPMIELSQPLAGDLAGGSTGTLTIGGQVPVFYGFDTDNKAVYLLSGMMAQGAELAPLVAGLVASPDHPMYAAEARLDTSGQGMLLWLDANRLTAAMAAGGPGGPGGMPGMMALPPGTLGSIAIGWGTRDGKGRLGLAVEIPRAGMAMMLPRLQNRLDLTTRGEPWLLTNINLPLQQVLQTAESFMQMNPEAYADYQMKKTAFADSFGLDYGQLAATFGPEMLFFGDDVGEFAAVRVGNQEALDILLGKLAAIEGVLYEQQDIDGVVYHHVAFPSLDAVVSAVGVTAAPETPKERFTNILNRLNSKAKSHVYWIQDGAYLVFAQVPQLLMDRVASTDRIGVEAWLRDKQGQDPSNALMLFSAQMDDVPQRAYYAWLASLLWVGDLVGEPVNLFEATPASQLSLPKSGSYGMQFDLGDPYLSLELSFDFTPVDFLFARSSIVTAAVIGMAIGIASENEQFKAMLEGEAAEQLDADCGGEAEPEADPQGELDSEPQPDGY